MIDYKIVKYCGICRKRFLVNKGENKRRYCDTCEKIASKQNRNWF